MFDFPLFTIHLHYNIIPVYLLGCRRETGCAEGWWHARGQLWGPRSSKWMVAKQKKILCVCFRDGSWRTHTLRAWGDMLVLSREPSQGPKTELLCSERLLSSTHSPIPHTPWS